MVFYLARKENENKESTSEISKCLKYQCFFLVQVAELPPATARIADTKENRLVLPSGFFEGFLAPWVPVDWIVRVLKKMGDFSFINLFEFRKFVCILSPSIFQYTCFNMPKIRKDTNIISVPFSMFSCFSFCIVRLTSEQVLL